MQYYSFDFETTGLNPHKGDRAFAYAIADTQGHVKVHKMNKKGIGILHDFFSDTSIIKIMHNAKFDLSFLPCHGIEVPETTKIHDTYIMSHLLRNLAPTHSLDGLCKELCGYPNDLDKEVAKEAKQLGGYQYIPSYKMYRYQKADVERTQLLFQSFFPEIRRDPKLKKDYEMELELIWVTMRLEAFGIKIHKKNCNKLINELQSECDIIHEEMFERFGEYVNLNSNDEVAKILFEKLKFMPVKFNKTGPSVDIDVINSLRESHKHPVLDYILKHRTYQKGISMLGSYLELADDNGILYPSINTNGAKRTGRESSQNPNLQNVSKSTNPKNPYTVKARSIFQARTGRILFFVDYSGIEMRLIVERCGQKKLMDIINKNGDVHEPAAICFYGKSYTEEKDKVKKKTMRNAAKNAHFAIAYGAGPYRLATTLNLSIEKTIRGYERYKARFPEVAGFTSNLAEIVKEQGYVVTPFGRKLYIFKDKPYSAANYLIQGYASGILKRAQIYVDNYCKEKWPDIRLVIPIHDELIISYPRTLLKFQNIILPEISRLMTNIPDVTVRLDVEWRKTISNWDKAKDIEVVY